MFWGLGFRGWINGVGFEVQGLGSGLGCGVLGLDCWFRTRVEVSYPRVGFGLDGFGVWCWGFERLVYAVGGFMGWGLELR